MDVVVLQIILFNNMYGLTCHMGTNKSRSKFPEFERQES